jgi:hypothetical protein
MKILFAAAAAAMAFLAPPAFAQNAAPPAAHDHAAPSQPAAPGPAPETSKPGMKMMEHCKMMQKKEAGKKGMDCHAMHQKMHGADGAAPGH